MLFALIPLLALSASACDDAAAASERALKANDVAGAKRILSSVQESCSGSISFLEMAGIASEMSRDFRSADKAFTAALALDPNSPLAFFQLTRVLIETSQSARLEHLLAVRNRPMPPALLFSLGTLLAQHGMYERALEYLERIPSDAADDAVYFNLGLVCSHLGRFEAAREHYFSAIDKQPNYTEAYFHTGLDYASAGDPRKAIPWLFRAHEWNPERPDISYALAEQLLSLEYFDTAEQVIAKALESAPADALVLTAQGDLKQAKGDAGAAIEVYEKIVTAHPGFAPAMVGIAKASESHGNQKRAIDSLHAVLSADPGNPAANGELGSIEIQKGEWSAALEHLNRAWAQDHSNSKVALGLSRALLEMNRPREALAPLQSLPAEMRDSRACHIALERIYVRLHRDADAATERAAIKLQAQPQEVLQFAKPATYVY